MSVSELLTKFKPLKQRYQFLLFVIAWLICNEVLSRVLFDNLSKEIYPIDADSIGIPMMSNLFLGFLVGFFCLLGLGIPKTKYWGLISLASIAFATLMTLLGALFWLSPNHYIASLGHVLPLLICSYMLVSSWVKRKQKMKAQEVVNEVA